MSLGELRTLAQLHAPVIVTVFRDDALELIRSMQYRRGLVPFGTTFAGPDLGQIAAAFGLSFYRATTVRQCASFTRAAVEGGRATLLEVQIDVSGYPTSA
jgi:thiamine pyrophosphate-dependent acetolactate synthase large subunit-like protein